MTLLDVITLQTSWSLSIETAGEKPRTESLSHYFRRRLFGPIRRWFCFLSIQFAYSSRINTSGRARTRATKRDNLSDTPSYTCLSQLCFLEYGERSCVYNCHVAKLQPRAPLISVRGHWMDYNVSVCGHVDFRFNRLLVRGCTKRPLVAFVVCTLRPLY